MINHLIMDLTFIYPAFNRANLFRATLESHLVQEGRSEIPYEIVVVDDGSEDNLFGLVQEYYARFLPIRYIEINVDCLDYPIYKTSTGANNPGPAINTGIRAAQGTWVVLSSPETILSDSADLMLLQEFTKQEHYKSTSLLGDVWDDGFQAFICGGPDHREFPFLAVYNRSFLIEIGGMEEAYVSGWGFEDTEFLNRMKKYGSLTLFDRRIKGTHQAHPRAEFSEARNAFVRSEAMYKQHESDPDRKVANLGHDWGSSNLIVKEWP